MLLFGGFFIVGRRKAFQEIERIERNAVERHLGSSVQGIYAAMLHQLSVYFSENVDSSLSHNEFMDFWVTEITTAYLQGKRVLDPNKPEKIINLLPTKGKNHVN